MVIKWGAIVTNGVGSIGGQFIKRIRGGHSMNNKPSRGSLQVLRNNARLSYNISVIRSWKTLPSATKTEWQNIASNYEFPDKFGTMKTLTGYQFYIKQGVQYLWLNGSQITPGSFTDLVSYITGAGSTGSIETEEFFVEWTADLVESFFEVRIDKIGTVTGQPYESKSRVLFSVLNTGNYENNLWNIVKNRFGAINQYDCFNVTITPYSNSGFKGIPYYYQWQILAT